MNEVSPTSKPALPRFTKLDAFDPHRKSFECKHEAQANPPISAEAEALFQQGLAATSYELWPDDREYRKAAQLWRQAAQLGHWKAQFNLAGLYLKGQGVDEDVDKALALTEDLMSKGVPAAWDNMGAYYMGGVGPLKQDATVAYAFWQKAAGMGSMAAQAYLGEKLLGTYDDPPSFWGNRDIGLKMLECAYAQGSAKGAFELGLTLSNTSKEYVRALQILQDGVKLGSEKAANYLFGSFDDGDALVGGGKDAARAERYSILGDALWRNPALRFPNLDKVLPLPPAQLPKWDGNKQTLIDAAKAVQPLPPSKPTAASQRTGRAHMPDGLMLAGNPPPLSEEVQALPHAERAAFRGGVAAQLTGTQAAFTGYWLPEWHHAVREHELAFNRSTVPLHYKQGETFDVAELHGIPKGVRPALHWHYMGLPVAVPQAVAHPKVVQGIARLSRQPRPAVECKGDQRCPHTGIWIAQLPPAHARAIDFNAQLKQAYLAKDQPFPVPGQMQVPAGANELTWVWMDNANDIGFAGFADLSLTDLHDAEGNPLA